MIDAIVHRRELKPILAKLLRFYPSQPCEDRPRRRRRARNATVEETGQPTVAHTAVPLTPEDAWHAVQLARNPNRPFTLDYIGLVFNDFFELHGDRQYGDDPAIVGGLCTLGD